MSLLIPSLNLPSVMKHSVRRCLFERPTAEKKEKDFLLQESKFKQEEEERAKLFREKWGLDPITGCCISGAQYECVPVDTTVESIPSFYTRGYPDRKPRPVQSLRRERSQFDYYLLPTRLNFDSPPRPPKRRYPKEIEDDHDENEAVFSENSGKRVPADGDRVITSDSSRVSSNSSSPMLSSTSVEDKSSLSANPAISFQHPKLTNSTPMPDILSRSTDLCTPQQRPRSLTQKTIKDYLPCKKQRCSTKKLPRT